MSDYLDKKASLTPLARQVIFDKATQYPHSGDYNDPKAHGTYLCRRCGLALFRASSQFASGCGWPAFDEDILDTVKQIPDEDGVRTEIVCARCEAHLGHVFVGEYFTAKNLRHCVNAVSIDFVLDKEVVDTEEAMVAGGCFWGVEYYLNQLPGVLKCESGYTGGFLEEPSYEAICRGNTGHFEAVRVVYDKSKTDYYQVLKRFFEIHDPTQSTGQGPDLGAQYQSAIFYYNQEQLEVAKTLIHELTQKGYAVVTQLIKAQPFWQAESYHQEYYQKQGKTPYCHKRVKRFS